MIILSSASYNSDQWQIIWLDHNNFAIDCLIIIKAHLKYDAFCKQIKQEESDSDTDKPSITRSKTGQIVLNGTSEFCRSLGDIPTYGQAGNRAEEEEDELLVRIQDSVCRNNNTIMD